MWTTVAYLTRFLDRMRGAFTDAATNVDPVKKMPLLQPQTSRVATNTNIVTRKCTRSRMIDKWHHSVPCSSNNT